MEAKLEKRLPTQEGWGKYHLEVQENVNRKELPAQWQDVVGRSAAGLGISCAKTRDGEEYVFTELPEGLCTWSLKISSWEGVTEGGELSSGPPVTSPVPSFHPFSWMENPQLDHAVDLDLPASLFLWSDSL